MRIALWTFAGLILLLPLIAMQVTDQVAWTVADFVVAGALLFGTGAAFQSAMSRSASTAYRAAAGVALAAALILVWMNLAVGLIGSEDNPANRLYGGVLAVGIAGAVAARFRPAGMVQTLLGVALAQVLVAVAVLTLRWWPDGLDRPGEILILTGLFTTAWLVSAWLFAKAAGPSKPADAAAG